MTVILTIYRRRYSCY